MQRGNERMINVCVCSAESFTQSRPHRHTHTLTHIHTDTHTHTHTHTPLPLDHRNQDLSLPSVVFYIFLLNEPLQGRGGRGDPECFMKCRFNTLQSLSS